MKRILWGVGLVAILAFGPVYAQLPPGGSAPFVVLSCPGTLTPSQTPGGLGHSTVDVNGILCTNAGASSLSGGFTAAATGTPITAATGAGATGTLPAGAIVVATNVGSTNGAYCALGASASTSSQYLSPGGGWFAFQVGSATQLTCVTTASTTTVNLTGGAGLPTGTGGGGGSGGGAVTLASGAVASSAYSAGAFVLGSYVSGAIADLYSAAPPTPYAGSGAATAITELDAVRQNMILPMNMPVNITEHECGGTLTLGGTAQALFTTQTTLHGFRIQNTDTGHNAEPISWSTTLTTTLPSPASSATPIVGTEIITAGTPSTWQNTGSYTSPLGEGINNPVWWNAATTGHVIQCKWW